MFRIVALLLTLAPTLLLAQTETAAPADTTIYDFADEAPRFPSRCEGLDTTAAVKAQCSQMMLLAYVNQKALYPAKAREENISGTAVIGFVVEKDGIVSRAKVLRDPGGQLGIAALRAVIGMAREVRFRPAYKDGAAVRFNYVLPVRFKLKEPEPYVIVDRDTVYTELTKPLTFDGPDGKLGTYFDERLEYPPSGVDSCRTGQLDLQLLVTPAGRVKVQDVIDYNDLGTDFTFAAMSVATSSFGRWSPAEYEGRPVTAAYNISVTFAPEAESCATVLEGYNEAIDLMNEGQALAQDSTTLAAGLAKMDRAVAYFPRDGRFRIVRGQTRMDNNMLEGACEDLSLAKSIALIDWYDGILPLICRPVEE